MRTKANICAVLVASVLAVAMAAVPGRADGINLKSTFEASGGPTSIPYGWVDFCHRQPQECSQAALSPVDISLTKDNWLALNKVNRMVNQTIIPVSNYDHWGTMLDHWDYPVDGKGDCKIYALWKRKLLMDAGFPRQALLMTIVRDENGEGHTILTVRTDHGDFILDNMRQDIRSWDDTGYQFYKRQSQQDPNIWVSIVGSEPVAATSSVPQRTGSSTGAGLGHADRPVVAPAKKVKDSGNLHVAGKTAGHVRNPLLKVSLRSK